MRIHCIYVGVGVPDDPQTKNGRDVKKRYFEIWIL